MRSLGKTLLAFALLHSSFQGQICLLLQVFLDSLLFQYKSEFGNKEFMIWATVSSRACFCWLYRFSPSLAAKNIINVILVLGIWWWSCVEFSLALLEEGVCYDQCVLLAELYWPCPALFCTWRPNLPVTQGVSWLPTFAFQSPVMTRTFYLGVSSKRSCRSS